MTIFEMIYAILIGPIQLLFEVIFVLAHRIMGHPGLAIIALSLIMNLLVLPLYRRSDAMQEEARDTEERLSKGVNQIKKAFSGDERMMLLQTYYRQNNYKPTDALKGSVSLLLQIPFFIAAYQFLSHLDMLRGVSFGPIRDLAAQDELLVIGGLSINLLPVLMTVINIVSSAIYLKGFPMKTKVQLYAMALLFLVFLYTSPAGLVFYWTLNNLFSLVKNILHKYMAKKPGEKKKTENCDYSKGVFLAGVVFLTMLIGVLIPSTVITVSAQEFIKIYCYYNPLWYIAETLCYATGTFLVWMRVFYWISSPKGKNVFDKIIIIMCMVMTANFLFFGTGLGTLNSDLAYIDGMSFTKKELTMNIAVSAVLIVLLVLVCKRAKWKKIICSIIIMMTVTLGIMGGFNIYEAKLSIDMVEENNARALEEKPSFELSKNGKNVVVIMIDRGIGAYMPYLINEKPELKETFDGFTYYPNVVSFGGCTNFGVPCLYGGYEYTPIEMNKRDDESLMDKHNEALLLMPRIFDENNYDVTVLDPPYANYNWIPDLSIYDKYPNMDAYVTEGLFGDEKVDKYQIECRRRNFFCYSVMKTMPLCLQELIYDRGSYNYVNYAGAVEVYRNQTTDGLSKAEGLYVGFMKSYNVIHNMNNMTEISEGDKGTFMIMSNHITHEPMLLQEPEYIPAQIVDNTAYDEANWDRFTVDGITMKVETETHMAHYQTNMAIMIQLGEWLDYLRENEVYDNTRIIIVSDHGRALHQFENMFVTGDDEDTTDIEFYYPLLMVKDFDSKGFEVDENFMTNADVPTLAMKDVIQNPINPFTGKEVNNEEKYAHDQYIIASTEYDVRKNNGNTYNPAKWYAVKDDMRKKENWRYIDEETTMPSELR